MNMLSWLRAGINILLKKNRENSLSRKKSNAIENGTYIDGSTFGFTNFESDYKLSTGLIRGDLNSKFPDNYHAGLMSKFEPGRNYTESRLEAIDTSSSAISTALRSGASVREAASIGLRSIGLQPRFQ